MKKFVLPSFLGIMVMLLAVTSDAALATDSIALGANVAPTLTGGLGILSTYPVPEPGTMILLGSGLVGLANWGPVV